MTDVALLLDELVERLREEHDLEQIAREPHAEGFRLSFHCDSDPFEEIEAEVSHLRPDDDWKRRVMFGEGETDGLHVIYRARCRTLGPFVEVPDEVRVDAWFGPAANPEERARLRGMHQAAVAEGAMDDLLSALRKIERLAPDEIGENLIGKVADINRRMA